MTTYTIIKDLYLGNLRRAIHAARTNARHLDECAAGKHPDSTAPWMARIQARKWRRQLHAIHHAAIERIEDHRHARKEEARFLGDA